MRLEDTISKCSASVTILADGRECPEYDIKGDETGNLCCYIPLMSDQVISVQISLDMTSEHFEVDLFTDGVIRNFWQSTRNAVNRHRAPNVEFTQGIYKDGRSLYRANMTTIDIPNGTCPCQCHVHYSTLLTLQQTWRLLEALNAPMSDS